MLYEAGHLNIETGLYINDSPVFLFLYSSHINTADNISACNIMKICGTISP